MHFLDIDPSSPSDMATAWRRAALPVANETYEKLRQLGDRASHRGSELIHFSCSNKCSELRLDLSRNRKYPERDIENKLEAVEDSVSRALRHLISFTAYGLKAPLDNPFDELGYLKIRICPLHEDDISGYRLFEWFDKVPEDESVMTSIVQRVIQTLNMSASGLDLVIQASVEITTEADAELLNLKVARQRLSAILTELESTLGVVSSLTLCKVPRPPTPKHPIDDYDYLQKLDKKRNLLRIERRRMRHERGDFARVSKSKTHEAVPMDSSTVTLSLPQ